MKSNYRNVMLNTIGMLALVISCALFPAGKIKADPGFIAQGCSNLGFTVQVNPINPKPDGSVEVAGLPLGAAVAEVNVSAINGTCNTGFELSPPGTDRPYKGFVVYETESCNDGLAKDRNGIVGIFCLTRYSGILEFNDMGSNKPEQLRARHSFTLQSKNFIGRKEINLREITKGFSSLYSTWGNYDWRLKPVKATIDSGKANTLVLSYTPTCRASVNNVVFPGTPSPSSISNGTVGPQQANVQVQCNDILPKYSIEINSLHGIHGDKKDGVIKSRDNNTVGYRLTWGADIRQSGLDLTANGNVGLLTEQVLVGGKLPAGNNFSIPVDITPVSLAPAGKDVMPGPVNAEMIIQLKFN